VAEDAEEMTPEQTVAQEDLAAADKDKELLETMPQMDWAAAEVPAGITVQTITEELAVMEL
jgi:hypothetical protein